MQPSQTQAKSRTNALMHVWRASLDDAHITTMLWTHILTLQSVNNFALRQMETIAFCRQRD